MRHPLCCAMLLAFSSLPALTQAAQPDSDRDGLSDAQEAALLQQFAPHFLVSRNDCSGLPAAFQPALKVPQVAAENGTIYGQASPAKGRTGEVELHFYHLWRRDCGEMGHALDTEHVSSLVHLEGSTGTPAWKAVYWYAAAHEDTLCDASQITRAAPVDALDRGPKVWISAGKHASFLSEQLCRSGCGGDRCLSMETLLSPHIVNLGEANAPTSNTAWSASSEWPLLRKMSRTDFTEARTLRLEHLPLEDVAWAVPSRRPAQAALLGGNAAIAGTATGLRASDDALDLSQQQMGDALAIATKKTGSALNVGLHRTAKALASALHHTAKAVSFPD